MVGSRFTSPAEQNYSAVEGELQAVVDGLHRTRYYTQGCEKLIVGVDHKPLLGIINDKRLEDIDNLRIRRLKEKTFGWKFKIIHIQGRQHGAPDAMSRGVPSVQPSEEHVQALHAQLGGRWDVLDQDHEVSQEVSCKEVRSHMLGLLRSVSDGYMVTPDPEVDMSGEVLASMDMVVKSVTWDGVKQAISRDTTMLQLLNWIEGGCHGEKEGLPSDLQVYWALRDKLSVSDGVPMYDDRTIIPKCMRQAVLTTLHSAHQGVTGMTLRAATAVYWPGITSDIQTVRDRCLSCQNTTPTQSKLPPVTPIVPEYPFQHICLDYMTMDGHNYGVFVDRYSNWVGVYSGPAATDVVTCLAQLCENYGIPVTCTTDGGPQYTAEVVQKFMKDYGIQHRLCSVANAHANTRAELGVKTVKRMIRDCRTIGGTLDRPKLGQALLQYRNTQDRDTGVSPAQALFGRPLRDFLPRTVDQLTGDLWQKAAKAREEALKPRLYKASVNWSMATKDLPPLAVGDNVMIQNQTGNHPRRWDKRGKVVRVMGHDQYQVMVAGSRRVTLRNRRYLKTFKVFEPRPFVSLPSVREHGLTDEPGKEDHGIRVRKEYDGTQLEHAGGELVPPPVSGGQVPVAEDRDLHLENHQGEVHNVPVPSDPVAVDEEPVVTPLRRSGRTTKGVTSRFKDFVP